MGGGEGGGGGGGAVFTNIYFKDFFVFGGSQFDGLRKN